MRLLNAATLMLAFAAPALAQEADQNWIQAAIANLDAAFGSIVSAMSTVLFAKLGTGVPLIIWVLVLGGIYYSFYFGWISLRGFRHSIDVIRGRYDDPNDPGEISISKPSPAPCRLPSVSVTSPASPLPSAWAGRVRSSGCS